MADEAFEKVQQQMKSAFAELKTATDPARRRMLLREMSQLLADAQRISSQPPKVRNKDS
jgi:hypothetical protein